MAPTCQRLRQRSARGAGRRWPRSWAALGRKRCGAGCKLGRLMLLLGWAARRAVLGCKLGRAKRRKRKGGKKKRI